MIFLLIFSIFSTGIATSSYFIKKLSAGSLLSYGFLLGSIIVISFLYILNSYLIFNLPISLIIISIFSALILLFSFKLANFNTGNTCKSLGLFSVIAFLAFIFFERGFFYKNNTFFIASNLYLDLGAHIPFIRSLSLGNNFPFEVPFYGGEKLIYHFMYDFYTAILEYSGIKIDYAYNIISAFTMSSLFFVSINISRFLFREVKIGIIAFFLFFLEPSLSILNIISLYRQNFIRGVLLNNTYHFNSVLGENTIGNFLYINSYLNQRHLLFTIAASASLVTLLLDLINRKKLKNLNILVLGVILGLIPFWNFTVFIVSFYILSGILLLKKVELPKLIIFFAATLIISVPQFILVSQSATGTLQFKPGFLIANNFSLIRISIFWFLNLGFSIPLLMVGVLRSNKFGKHFFVILAPVFFFPNLFQFTKDMFDNHKFFNYWYFFICFYVAYSLHILFKKSNPWKVMGVVLVILLTISGISDLFVVKNDVVTSIPDYSYYPFIQKVKKEIKKTDTVFTNGEIYDPLSISGIKTYLGRSHYIFLYGGSAERRIQIKKEILTQNDKASLKKALIKEKIKYVILYKDQEVKNIQSFNEVFFNTTLIKVYEDQFAVFYKI